jgi:hypothetical protein
MGYTRSDLTSFLERIAAEPGVRNVYVRQTEPNGLFAFIEVDGGLSREAYVSRRRLYDLIEDEIADNDVTSQVDFDYTIVPVGDDISPPHVPADMIPLRPGEPIGV